MNIDAARGYLSVLGEEINDPARSGMGGHRNEWQIQKDELDRSLSVLKELIAGASDGLKS